jgi:hypothetical protein
VNTWEVTSDIHDLIRSAAPVDPPASPTDVPLADLTPSRT